LAVVVIISRYAGAYVQRAESDATNLTHNAIV
jgi:hypothetical protein